jgi:hypothetical protein
MEEIWKDIKGYEGFYQISNLGRVKTLNFKVAKILKNSLDSRGYYQVKLKDRKSHLIHHLVMKNFVSEKPSPDHQVNHINGVKTDNYLENLEWVTRSQNMLHAYKLGLNYTLGKKGSSHPNASITENDVKEIRKSNLTSKELGEKYNLSYKTICAIRAKKSWKHI